MGGLAWALTYKRGLALRLARTLEAELKAIAGAMDEGAIQSMWDSHPTLDSIRRRRRGERDLWPHHVCTTAHSSCAAVPGELSHEEMIMELASRARGERPAAPPLLGSVQRTPPLLR